MVFKEFIKHLFWLIVGIAIFLVIGSLLSCEHKSRIKIYKFDSGRGLFIRDLNDKDVLRFKEAHGYFCISPADLERLAEEVVASKNMRDSNKNCDKNKGSQYVW